MVLQSGTASMASLFNANSSIGLPVWQFLSDMQGLKTAGIKPENPT